MNEWAYSRYISYGVYGWLDWNFCEDFILSKIVLNIYPIIPVFSHKKELNFF